jgi:hypothetical protein
VSTIQVDPLFILGGYLEVDLLTHFFVDILTSQQWLGGGW